MIHLSEKSLPKPTYMYTTIPTQVWLHNNYRVTLSTHAHLHDKVTQNVHLKCGALKGSTCLVEETVEVDVDTVPYRRVEEDVLSVSVPKTQDVAHHTHDGRGPTIRQSRIVPVSTQQTLLRMYINSRIFPNLLHTGVLNSLKKIHMDPPHTD